MESYALFLIVAPKTSLQKLMKPYIKNLSMKRSLMNIPLDLGIIIGTIGETQ
jgi:hypothetical protein